MVECRQLRRRWLGGVGVRVEGPTARISDWRLGAQGGAYRVSAPSVARTWGRVAPSERSARRRAGRQNDAVDEFRLIPNVAHCEILVNDVPLLDLVTECEHRLHVDPAGAYLLLPGELALFPSRYLLGEHTVDSSAWCSDWESWGFGKDKTAIAGCTCGDVGCWPLVVSIELERGVVIWHDFVSRRSQDYHLGFTFARKRYEHELVQSLAGSRSASDTGS